MRYNTTLFLIASCVATSIHCMDNEQKTLVLKAQFATMSWLQNADASKISIDGLSRELATTENKAALQQVVLAALRTVSLKFPLSQSIWPIPTIDMQKMYAIAQVIDQIKKEEAELKEKQRLEAIERRHHANITMLLEFNGIQSGFDYCREQQLPAWKYLPSICLAIGDNR